MNATETPKTVIRWKRAKVDDGGAGSGKRFIALSRRFPEVNFWWRSVGSGRRELWGCATDSLLEQIAEFLESRKS